MNAGARGLMEPEGEETVEHTVSSNRHGTMNTDIDDIQPGTSKL